MQPTLSLELHPHQEIHLPSETDTVGCCGCFSSKSKKKQAPSRPPSPAHDLDKEVEMRIKALADLKFVLDRRDSKGADDDNLTFEVLRDRINSEFKHDNAISPENLARMLKVFAEVKHDIEKVEKRHSKVLSAEYD